jgi:hypothetical protein
MAVTKPYFAGKSKMHAKPSPARPEMHEENRFSMGFAALNARKML